MDDLNHLFGMADDELTEQAQLIERGVRPLTILNSLPSQDSYVLLRVSTRLEKVSYGTTVIPFVINHDDGVACGFAGSKWVVETLRWSSELTEPYRSRVVGLLLGYSVTAIENFHQRQSIRWVSSLAERAPS